MKVLRRLLEHIAAFMMLFMIWLPVAMLCEAFSVSRPWCMFAGSIGFTVFKNISDPLILHSRKYKLTPRGQLLSEFEKYNQENKDVRRN